MNTKVDRLYAFIIVLNVVFFSLFPFRCVNAVNVSSVQKIQNIIPGNSSAYDHYSRSIAVDGEILAVGVPYHDGFWEDAGTVYVYRTTTDGKWNKITEISPPRQRQNGLFGQSLVLENGFLIVGEPGSDNDQIGLVHIYSGGTTNWKKPKLIRTLFRTDDCYLRERDKFGESLDLENGMLIIGAPKACRDRQNWGDTTGAAYLYKNYGATFLKKLTAYNGEDFDLFGQSVAVCGGNAIVGAPDADGGYLRSNTGAAYIFREDKNWGLHSFKRPSDTKENDRFASSVACDGGIAVIGAPSYSNRYGDDEQKGRVYVYAENIGGFGNWGVKTKLTEEDFYNIDSDRNNLFGNSVALKKNLLIVGFGESQKDDTEQEPVAHIFRTDNNQISPLKSLFTPKESSCDTSDIDGGFFVATDGDSLAIGDVEDESDLSSCLYGRGRVLMYSYFEKEVNILSPVYLLLKGD